MDGLRALAVVLVVVTAGCSLPSEEATTVTPVEIDRGDPPGISTRTDSVAADRLLDAHRGILENQSYALVVDRTERQNGTDIGGLSVDAAFGPTEDTFRYEFRATGRMTVFAWPNHSRYWSTDGRALLAREYGTETVYDETQPARWRLPIEPTRTKRLAEALAVTNVTTTETTADGVTVELQTDRTDPDLEGLWSVEEIEDVRLRLSVTPDGLIESYDLEYTLLDDGQRVTVSETGRIDGVGSTTPERPEWVAAAEGDLATPDRDRPGD